MIGHVRQPTVEDRPEDLFFLDVVLVEQQLA